MTWQSVDFLGISLNDRSLVTKLDEFLKSHEEHISHALVHQVNSFVGGIESEEAEEKHFEFDGAVKEIQSILQSAQASKRLSPGHEQWKTLSKNINNMLWEQVELLEGFVSELFHQLSFVSVLKWQSSLKDIVEGFTQILLQHISVTKKCIASLNELFRSLGAKGESNKSWLPSWLNFWKKSNGIDGELIDDLQNCESVLLQQTKQFIEQYAEYEKVNLEVNEKAQKLKGYEILYSLGTGSGEQYEALYKFLRIWERLAATHTAPQEAIFRSFQHFSRDKTYAFLRGYYEALEEALFEKSRTLKTSPRHLFSDMLGRTFILETVKGFRREVHTLANTIGKLRDFLLKSDPDPYVRARWGFVDTPTGNAPKYTQKLADLGLEVEQLDGDYNKLLTTLEQGPKEDERDRLDRIDAQLSRMLHLIAQPLTGSIHYKSHTEKVLQLLDEADELGSYGRETVDYVRYVLGRLLRSDWKEHRLTTVPHFRRIYKIHQGIIGPPIDQAHERRLTRFEQLLHQVKRKMRSEETAHDIDYDISDIKGYLQDFFATLQRAVNDESIGPKRALRHIEEAAQQLLEYRYRFGEFFASLKNEPEGYYIRQQFLFVDQYFEAIENKIYEIRLQRGLVTAEE